MSDFVERVARAYEPELWARIDRDISRKTNLKKPAQRARDINLKRARAVIAAMAVPTDEMIVRGARAILPGMLTRYSALAAARMAYVVMLESTLRNPEPVTPSTITKTQAATKT